MDNGIPSKIGRYEIDRLLGAGAMGFVYLGRDPALDRSVAIKTVRDPGMDAETLTVFVNRFRNEARAAARLHHPSIVQVYDVGEDDECGPFLVFEYVPGATLKQILRSKGPLSAEDAVRLALEVGEAIDTAHGEGIIHRDIKPDNLLVTTEGRTKLADFGVARVPNASLTREGQFLGTPCYAAPETLGGGTYSPQSDVFSFGAVLYEIVAGERAFPGDEAVAVASKVINEDPPPPSTVAKGSRIPAAVDDVLMWALEKKAEARPTTATELAEAFRDAYGDPDSRRFPERPLSRASDGPRSPKRSSGSGFAVFLLGALALGAALVFAFSNQETTAEERVEPEEASISPVRQPRRNRRRARPTRTVEPDAGGIVVLEAGPVEPIEAGAGDANVGAGDLAIDEELLSTKDREEAAKDALDKARELIAKGEHEQARAALLRAEQLDPQNQDIAAVRAEIPE